MKLETIGLFALGFLFGVGVTIIVVINFGYLM